MAEQQLSIRSTRARNLAHKLAKKEQRTVSQIVERALDAYVKETAPADRETDAGFWQRVNRDYATEVDLEAIIKENRKPQRPIEF
jgi:predicted transcriptional regulator